MGRLYHKRGWYQMRMMIRKEKEKQYPSLYDVFSLGDRVKRAYLDKNGRPQEYAGIVLAISTEGMEVCWDTKDGNYKPKKSDISFTNCPINEIFEGTEHYTPIKKSELTL